MSKGRYRCGVCDEDFYSHCLNLVCPIGYWNAASANPEDVEDCDDPLERERSRWYDLGKIVGAEDVSRDLLERSGKAFTRCSDREAQALRDLSQTIGFNAAAARAEYDKKYKKGKKQ